METYRYMKEGFVYVVRRWKDWENGKGKTGTKVSEHFTKEEAKTEVYRLNGWKAPLIPPNGGNRK